MIPLTELEPVIALYRAIAADAEFALSVGPESLHEGYRNRSSAYRHAADVLQRVLNRHLDKQAADVRGMLSCEFCPSDGGGCNVCGVDTETSVIRIAGG